MTPNINSNSCGGKKKDIGKVNCAISNGNQNPYYFFSFNLKKLCKTILYKLLFKENRVGELIFPYSKLAKIVQ